MGEVMRWKLKGFLPGVDGVCGAVMRPEVVLSLHYDAERLRADTAVADANDAERKLAALREELAEIKESLAYRGSLLNRTQQRAEAAEQRNAELVELLKGVPFGFHTDMPDRAECKCSRCDFLRGVKAALKPTESGASHVD